MTREISQRAAEVLRAEAQRAIRGYRGNLLAVKKAYERGWVPSGAGPGIAEHVQTLRDHLAATTGVVENDDFLLRYALTVPGMQRGIDPPVLVLEPNRSGFSERRKREAAGQVTRLREVLTLGRAFLDGLSTDTAQAFLELASLAEHPEATGGSSRLNSLVGLSIEEARSLALRALEFLNLEQAAVVEFGTDLLMGLACFRFEPLAPEVHRVLRERAIYWPSPLFRDAGDDEARALLAVLDDASETRILNHVLLCLAWTRGATAEEAFRTWNMYPPAWASRLNAPPADYPPFAGWTFTTRGKRVSLITTRCRRLLPADGTASDAVLARVTLDQNCPCCDAPLAALLDFVESSITLPDQAPRRVVACLDCSCFEPTFTRYREDGSWEWLSPTERRERTDSLPVIARKIASGLEECPPFSSANTFEIDDATALGGVPMWLQDAEYPRCPGCSETMTFLAQHDNGVLHEEGLHYAFYCPSCRVAAVSYQQT